MTNKASLAVLCALCCALAVSVKAQEARLQIDQLNHLANRAKESVDVTMDRPAVQLVAKLTTLDAKDQSRFRELAQRIQGIYVRAFEFENEGEYNQSDVESVRAQLRSPAWQRLVQVRDRNGESNEVYYVTRVQNSEWQMEGMAVITAEPRRLCVANIVGQMNLDDLGLLDREFGVSSCGKGKNRRERVRR
ncbi:MAG: DUF4252 domain-containing protein [Acidobacteria bacterium]|nr:DUF4252 domain-containing protein [Acidobacteriota bacterium]MBI3423658.1 DUF4252 domain-containing protein [Acidobacteriota bacterium]